jgi:hypothetical protein
VFILSSSPTSLCFFSGTAGATGYFSSCWLCVGSSVLKKDRVGVETLDVGLGQVVRVNQIKLRFE